jgi:hypothetical protein
VRAAKRPEILNLRSENDDTDQNKQHFGLFGTAQEPNLVYTHELEGETRGTADEKSIVDDSVTKQPHGLENLSVRLRSVQYGWDTI